MWTAVHMVTGLSNAHKIEEKLKLEGFIIKVNFFSKDGNEDIYEILAPEFEADDVQQAMIELGII